VGAYTLKISGQPIDDARTALEAAEGVHVSSPAGAEALVVTADAPSHPEAEELVRAALPANVEYSIARPAALEDEDD
jgi:hypothetical protein